ncbi:MAG TPA: metallophosphoesterase, partial [Arthrobacter bacterium]|nr:metallophosphoesterase [Arthrobacter sp.]HCN21345.1 metallophosphoesterase [Arthrobacter sp.]
NRERYAGWPRGTRDQDNNPHLRVAVIHAPYQRVLDHFTQDGADLLLAGHTHGGQLCIPGYGALVSNCDLPTWRAKGLNTWESRGRTTPVNVSGGIGTSRFAPIRIACKPEAVLLTLTAPE